MRRGQKAQLFSSPFSALAERCPESSASRLYISLCESMAVLGHIRTSSYASMTSQETSSSPSGVSWRATMPYCCNISLLSLAFLFHLFSLLSFLSMAYPHTSRCIFTSHFLMLLASFSYLRLLRCQRQHGQSFIWYSAPPAPVSVQPKLGGKAQCGALIHARCRVATLSQDVPRSAHGQWGDANQNMII